MEPSPQSLHFREFAGRTPEPAPFLGERPCRMSEITNPLQRWL